MSPPSPSASSSSSHAYTPGPHRRSHPNLQSLSHLSLAPLTPRYPIDPADYNAYFDPSTSELHTSSSLRSLSTVANLPSPGGILASTPGGSHRPHGRSSRPGSRVGSRAASRTRHATPGQAHGGDGLRQKSKSSIGIQQDQHHQHPHHSIAPPSGALTSEGFGHKSHPHLLSAHSTWSNHHHNANLMPTSKSITRLHIPASASSSSWLIQTGLALTESSRETKGQSWLSKRDSSTSLASPIEERRPPRSASRATPSVSRRNSNRRNGSRRSLAMTPATNTGLPTPTTTHHHDDYYDHDHDIQPQWDDIHTQAEIAAIVESELVEELDGEEDDEFDDGDPYGVLDFDDHFDSEDEEDVRREISGYQLGRWMDGIVDVFLRLEDFPENTGGGLQEHQGRGNFDLEAGGKSTDQNRLSLTGSTKTGEGSSVVGDEADIEPPPEKPTGIWDDVTWFGRLLARSVRS
ncbi:hypothetical protein B0A52_03797 [Exophiala mesophila]|uniref:Uncharacterized protein n=1 Tax=Exophiala mesophila TaxID=212818 RepID=A0A438N767_EXOME|nr:hypothetical protein B0A52_03797 [Exophiala mesophila]